MLKLEYIENDLDNPKYLFSGSPLLLDYLEPQLAKDENHNPLNEDNAVYLTSSLTIASIYAFGDNLKPQDSNYPVEYATNRVNGLPYVELLNANLDDDLEGYLYVFKNNASFIHNGGPSLQYRSHNKIKPYDIIKIKFKDFKQFYNIKNIEQSNKNIK
jgi:hypothetical protein